jgi:hypothetical protein
MNPDLFILRSGFTQLQRQLMFLQLPFPFPSHKQRRAVNATLHVSLCPLPPSLGSSNSASGCIWLVAPFCVLHSGDPGLYTFVHIYKLSAG